jgi:hypothetical protein
LLVPLTSTCVPTSKIAAVTGAPTGNSPRTVGRDAELVDLVARGDAGLLEGAELGLGHPRLLLLGVADLKRGVTVALDGPVGGDVVAGDVQHGHGDPCAVVGEDLGHANLFGDNSELEIHGLVSDRVTASFTLACEERGARGRAV